MWLAMVIRDSVPESVTSFDNYYDAVGCADDWIIKFDPKVTHSTLPRYSRGESYHKDGLRVDILEIN
jgi:hypothetical protein